MSNKLDLKKLFNQLPGVWTLERQTQSIDGQGVFTGTCTFTALDDGRLLCEENGIMTLNGHTNEANRSYIYECHDDHIVILYNDPHRKGDVLHILEFNKEGDYAVAKHCHVCEPDTYDLTFTMLSDDIIDMKYIVKGPKKDYAMQSVLTRQP